MNMVNFEVFAPLRHWRSHCHSESTLLAASSIAFSHASDENVTALKFRALILTPPRAQRPRKLSIRSWPTCPGDKVRMTMHRKEDIPDFAGFKLFLSISAVSFWMIQKFLHSHVAEVSLVVLSKLQHCSKGRR
ncbi:uncharacterized protein LAESUDRAFT_529062 [Laetiporus sulphureus 93-53]|uniref:Uncharacterized protein n=1 Tax=Laetiporus sulphureus 93-53 TaxID=1314785 RepID=A0A165BBW5_9APHY|nr:uncharacterized protein LAESUDRAFT_529062 [Laetiporus sulphureus 93-53]KZT00700.1 hypothetical protein LAESUDRAFT_529062 [Laetiporus sulphureus 93-53]